MTARQIDALLDERARLVTKIAAAEGVTFMAEIHLRRAQKLLLQAIMPSPALAAHRDVLVDEIGELLSEDRPHPAEILSADIDSDTHWPPTSPLPPDGAAGQSGPLQGNAGRESST